MGIPGTSRGLLVGLWDRQDLGRAHWWWESLGHPRDSQCTWDCGTDRTLVEPIFGGNPWDILGTPSARGTVGTDGTLVEAIGGGNPWDIPGTPEGTMGQTGPW